MSDCPSCGDDAYIQKVSGLYRQQRTGGRASELAGLLASPRVEAILPTHDQMESREGCLGVIMLPVFGLGGILIRAWG